MSTDEGAWIVHYERDTPHACNPPTVPDGLFTTRPNGNPGSVWRCGCGRLWQVVSFWCDCRESAKHYGQCATGHYGWKRLSRWRGFRYRNR